MQEVTIHEGFVLTNNLSWLKEKIEKFNRKSIRLGLEPMTINITNQTKVEKIIVNEYLNLYRSVHFTYVTITGETPKLDGWKVLGRIEHNRDFPENIVVSAPGQEMNHEYRTAKCKCDHCEVNRFRKDTFVLVNPEGEQKQIGRTCIKDYLGHKSAEAILEWSNFRGFVVGCCDGDDYRGKGHVPESYNLEGIITMAVACTREFGWVSRKMADERVCCSTSDNVISQLFDSNLKEKDRIYPTDADKAEAIKVIEWSKNLDASKSEYNHNAKMFTNAGIVPWKHIALVASLPASYKREVEYQNKIREQKEGKKPSEYVGKPGDRQAFIVFYQNHWTCDSNFGPIDIIKFYDDKGNIIVWKTGSCNELEGIQKNDKFIMVARIKDHKEFRDEKQTIVTRAKLEKAVA